MFENDLYFQICSGPSAWAKSSKIVFNSCLCQSLCCLHTNIFSGHGCLYSAIICNNYDKWFQLAWQCFTFSNFVTHYFGALQILMWPSKNGKNPGKKSCKRARGKFVQEYREENTFEMYAKTIGMRNKSITRNQWLKMDVTT